MCCGGFIIWSTAHGRTVNGKTGHSYVFSQEHACELLPVQGEDV